MKLKRSHKALIATLIIGVMFLLGLTIGASSTEKKKGKEIALLLAQLADKDAQISFVSNKTQSIESLLTSPGVDQQVINTVAKINSPPGSKRVHNNLASISSVSTVVAELPSAPPASTLELPPNYTYRLANGVPVASFLVEQSSPPAYHFNTYDLKLKGTITIADKQSASQFQMNSSLEPEEWKDIPVELTVVTVPKKHKILKPYANLGITGSIDIDQPIKPNLTASLSMSWLHPIPCLDLLNPRISANPNTVKFGIDPVGYNIGCHIKGLSDLWIDLGASIDTKTTPSIDLTLNTRL